jgi:hypothetical protein
MSLLFGGTQFTTKGSKTLIALLPSQINLDSRFSQAAKTVEVYLEQTRLSEKLLGAKRSVCNRFRF